MSTPHIMASHSNNGDDLPGLFSGRYPNDRAFEYVADGVNFSGDDGDDDDDDLNNTPPPFSATRGEPYYPGVTMCIVSTCLVEFKVSNFSLCCLRFAKKDRRSRETGKTTLLVGYAVQAYSSA